MLFIETSASAKSKGVVDRSWSTLECLHDYAPAHLPQKTPPTVLFTHLVPCLL